MPPAERTGRIIIKEEGAKGWLDRFFECWRTSDAERGARLFTFDAVFSESPYEQRWPQGKRMHGRDEIEEYWQDVTAGWPYIDGGYVLWAVKGDGAYGRLWADLRSRAEGYWVPLAHAFEATFVSSEDGTPVCSSWYEWKPAIPERLHHHEPHPLDRS